MPTWSNPSTRGTSWTPPRKNSARSFSAPTTIPTCSIGSSKENRSAFARRRLTEQELIALSKETGRELKTAPEARELRDVELRLKHMDKLGIDVQILFNTMWIARVADKAEAEIALCKSWNRWMAEVWKQGNNRLRWSCVVPAMTLARGRAADALRQGKRRRGGQPAPLRRRQASGRSVFLSDLRGSDAARSRRRRAHRQRQSRSCWINSSRATTAWAASPSSAFRRSSLACR